jgi:flagellar motor switch protein FliG
MREKALTVGAPEGDSIDGRSALAEILRQMDGSKEKSILDKLEGKDPDLGKDIRERLFTLDDVVRVNDKFLQEKIRAMSDRDLGILIAGKGEALRSKLFINMSKARGAMVLEEEKIASPVSRVDSQRVTGEFFTALRRAWERGDCIIEGRDTAEEWVR